MKMRNLIMIAGLLFSFTLQAGDKKEKEESCHEEPVSESPTKTELPGGSLYHLTSLWKDQNNNTTKFSELAGSPRLIAMVYTKCQTACPVLVKTLQNLHPTVPVDLFSFDSEKETVETMKEFVKKYKLDKNWTVHTANAGSVTELAAVLNIQYKKLPTGEYVHSNGFFLVDSNGEVKAKHEGLGKPSDDFAVSMKAVK